MGTIGITVIYAAGALAIWVIATEIREFFK